MESILLRTRDNPARLRSYLSNAGILRISLVIPIFFCFILLCGSNTSYCREKSFDVVSPAVFSSDRYPCSKCHKDRTTDPRQRKLSSHTEIVLTDHAEDKRWCLDCHAADDRDTLLLITGEKVGFDDSHRICRQCHAAIHNVWQLGLHGKRIGNWDGRPRYTLCATCHDPHNPGFRTIVPEPPPLAPEQTLQRPR
jgi:hypothetical protein